MFPFPHTNDDHTKHILPPAHEQYPLIPTNTRHVQRPKPLAKLGCLGVFSCCTMSGLRMLEVDGTLGRMKVLEEMT
jgi:hypothetical protein